jgi:transcriptional regulator with XRE-family HTH domain
MDADPWQRPELVAALQVGDFGALLRAWRKWTGKSQAATAARCGMAQPEISEIESGRRQVTSSAVRERILHGLGAPVALPSVSSGVGMQSDEEQSLELATRVSASDVGAITLGMLEAAFDDLAIAYPVTRPSDLLGPLRTHVGYVSRLLEGRSTLAEHQRLIVVGAWFSLLLATVHVDLQQERAATSRLRTAAALAEHAGHEEIRAWVLETRAWRAVTAGDYQAAVTLSKAGQKAAPNGSSAQVQATAQEGRALARLGDADGTHDAMDRVATLVNMRPTPDQPGHHYQYDPEKYTAYAGTTLAWLGDGAAEDYTRRLIFRLSAAESGGGWPRRLASARIDLALTLMHAGQLDEAAHSATLAVSSGHIAPSNYWRAAEVVRAAEARGLPEATGLREAYEVLRQHHPRELTAG